ncbi:MAG: serine hydrolase domain-containing protein [Brevundimonas sp.]|uniref:serine hydrolase domain-containing protein n=1 Tax=Brevundimonas sp. TaxID=1871086 RepID=UPI004033FCD5
MRRIAIIIGLASALGLTLPALAQAQTPASAARSADPGVLFWTPERREADFRRMGELVPHATVAASGSPRPLMQGQPLDLDVDAFMQAERTAGLLVIQDGKVRLERYGLGMTPQDPWVSFSMTKSLTSTLVGAAIRDGHIGGLDDQVVAYLPEMKGSAYDGVTLRQLLTMTSGAAWNEDYTDPNADVARMLVVAPDPGVDATISYMRRLPRAAEPGTRWLYNTGETNLVGVLLARAVGKPLSQYLSETIWRPAGMARDGRWLLDAGGKEVGGCCVSATLQDWGRVGMLLLDQGRIDGRAITPDGWFEAATRKQADIGIPGRGYGFQWWTTDAGTFAASGIFGQRLHVDPQRNLVVVILSAWPVATGAERSAARDALIARINQAVDGGG